MIISNTIETASHREKKEKKSFFFAAIIGERKKRSIILLLLFTLTFYLLIISISFVDKTVIYSRLNQMNLVPREDNFTTLYFENNAELPQIIAQGEEVSFSFTIYNTEGVDREYDYSVYFQNPSNLKIITVDEGTVFIKNREKKTIFETYTFRQNHEKEVLFVKLFEPKQEIHFTLSEHN
ncbi:MAG: hypothetical protein WC178_02395 [Candidatus Paceibacterota bacterium]